MEITKLEPSQKKKAAEILASAFFDYPMMIHYFSDPKKRKRWLPWYFEKTLNCAMRYGEVYITSDFSGVMFMLPPNHTRLTTGEYIRNGFLMLPFIMGRDYVINDECEKFVADTHEKLLKECAHYYLWGLVAAPDIQRKGVGSALLKVLMAKADAENLPIYLETHEQKNVTYYERFDFELIHTDTIPKHGLDIWCMLRKPGK